MISPVSSQPGLTHDIKKNEIMGGNMITERELFNLVSNIDALTTASLPLAMTLAFSGFSERIAELANEVNTVDSSNLNELKVNVAHFQNEVASEVIDDIWGQLQQVNELANDEADAYLKAAMKDEAISQSQKLLKGLQDVTPKHLPSLTERLTKEQFSQYLLLLFSEKPSGNAILKLDKWLVSMDPKEKARQKEQQKQNQLAQALINAIDDQDLQKIRKHHLNGLSLTHKNGGLDIEPITYAVETSTPDVVAGMFYLSKPVNPDYVKFMLSKSISKDRDDNARILFQYLEGLDETSKVFADLLLEIYEAGQVKYATMLFEYTDVDVKKDNRDYELLTSAINANSPELIEMLFERGIDINREVRSKSSKDSSGYMSYPSYHLARLYENWNSFDTLAKNGVNINKCYIKRNGKDVGETYLGQFVLSIENFTDYENYVIDKYVAAGAVLAINDNESAVSIIQHYSSKTELSYEQALKKFGYDVSLENGLITAIRERDYEAMDEYIDRKNAPIYARSMLEKPPLIVAIEESTSADDHYLPNLVARSSLPHDQNGREWERAIDSAIKFNRFHVFTMLLNMSKKYHDVLSYPHHIYMRLVKENKPTFLKLLIDYRQDYAFPTDEREIDDEKSLRNGYVVLIEAVKHGNPELLRLVIGTCNSNNGYTKEGKSAYELAQELGHSNILPLLQNQR